MSGCIVQRQTSLTGACDPQVAHGLPVCLSCRRHWAILCTLCVVWPAPAGGWEVPGAQAVHGPWFHKET